MPEIPLTPDARNTYEALFDANETAIENTADPELLESLNDTQLSIGAVLTADNAARLKQDDASFEALKTQMKAANDSLTKLQGDIAGVATKIKAFGEVATGITKVLGLFGA
jgi:hypothetical protein